MKGYSVPQDTKYNIKWHKHFNLLHLVLHLEKDLISGQGRVHPQNGPSFIPRTAYYPLSPLSQNSLC
jgi:hypothetical protein